MLEETCLKWKGMMGVLIVAKVSEGHSWLIRIKVVVEIIVKWYNNSSNEF